MRRLSLPIVIVVCIVIALGLTWLALSHTPSRGSEHGVQTVPVPAFKRVKVTGSAVVTLVQDTSGPVMIESAQGRASAGVARVSAVVHGDTLEITASDPPPWCQAPFH